MIRVNIMNKELCEKKQTLEQSYLVRKGWICPKCNSSNNPDNKICHSLSCFTVGRSSDWLKTLTKSCYI